MKQQKIVTSILGFTFLLIALVSNAQPKIKYSNNKFQKETSSRTLDKDNALLIGVSKKKKQIDVLDLYTGNILHSLDVTKHGLNEIEYYRTDEVGHTGFYRGKNGKLISYDYKTNKVNWVFDTYNVVDAPTIYHSFISVEIKPKGKGEDNYVIIDRSSGKVIRTTKDIQESKDYTWNTLYDDGEVSIHEKRKAKLSSAFVGDFVIEVRNSASGAVLKSHNLRGAPMYLKSELDVSNKQLLIYFPNELNATLKLAERGSLFTILAIDVVSGEKRWETKAIPKVDFHISELISISSYFIHLVSIEQNKLFFGGRDFLEVISLSDGKSLYKVPFSSSIHTGLLKAKLSEAGLAVVDRANKVLYVGEVSNVEKPSFSKYNFENGTKIWSSAIPKKVEIVPRVSFKNQNVMVQYNGGYYEEKAKSFQRKFITPVILNMVDGSSGNVLWSASIKDAVIESTILGDYAIAISEKSVHVVDAATGKVIKKLEHKVDLEDATLLQLLPDGKHILIWGNSFSVIGID